jgi:hypothetical protein
MSTDIHPNLTGFWMWRFLMKTLVSLTMAAVLVSAPGWALARTNAVPCTIQLEKQGLLAVQTEGPGALTETLTIHENEAIDFADLTFEDELPYGTEIEVWPAVEGETPPWDLTGESFPFRRNLWITDERTKTLVRFDVTAIVRAWESEQIPNLGFVLRITNDEETQEEGAQTGTPQYAFKQPAKATLTYSISAFRPPKDEDITQTSHQTKDPRKIPGTEDGRPH